MRDVVGYEGLYGVTEDGRVWSYTTERWRKQTKGKRGKGYMHVSLWKHNKGQNVYVHQMVAKAYIPNPEGKLTVNHEDGDVENNSRSNLSWATNAEQSEHAWSSGLTNNHGERCGTAKLTNAEAEALVAEYRAGGMSQQAIGNKYNVTQSQVSRIIGGQRRANQHKGVKHATRSTIQAVD